MINLLRGQILEMRTTRTFWSFVLVGLVLIIGLVCLGLALGSKKTGTDDVGGLASTLVLIFGLVGSTGAYRHGTAVAEELMTPARSKVLLAKIFCYGVFGLLFGAVEVILSGTIAALWPGAHSDLSGVWLEHVLQSGVAAGLSAMIGVALGSLIRVQAAAVAGTLVYLLVVGTILIFALGEKVYSFTLGGALADMGGSGFHSWGIAALLLLGWIALFSVATIALDRRRDIA